jgi:GntR family transcriptional regulator/MocR family aminotransferase
MSSTRALATWWSALELRVDASQPLFLQIARVVSEEVRRGRLKPGDALPGSRTLAELLGVHRNTVLTAYRELAAEGWIETSRARGTFVSRRLPERSPTRPRRARGAEPAFAVRAGRRELELITGEVPRGALALHGGVPDLRLVPVAALARAYRRALRQTHTLLGYGDARGERRLREGLAAMLASARGLAVEADELLVTRGSQMALELCSRALLRRGDVVAVESYGYRPAWRALESQGARIVGVPVDGEGIMVDRVARLADRGRLRAVYVTPQHQYPTTVTMSASRRLALLELAARARFAVIEDDYDHEFHYEGRPVLPLASADASRSVIYVGTLSKILAPGLRIGYVAGPRSVIDAMTRERYFLDRQGDHAIERAVAELIEDGEVQRHALRMRRVYRERRDVFAEALRAKLGGALEFNIPSGGMALWARAARGIDVEAWAERAAKKQVLVHTARRFTFDGKEKPFLRLGYSPLEPAQLRRAVDILASLV